MRILLGLVEGPLSPGIVLYLSGFYTRKELSLRYAAYRCYSGVDNAYIDHIELPYLLRGLRCVV